MAVTGGVSEKFPAGVPITMTTGAAVTAGRLVMIDGADRTVIHATEAATAVVGVALQTSSASGDKIAVWPNGIGVFSLVADGAVTRGDLLVVGAVAGTVKTLAANAAAAAATAGGATPTAGQVDTGVAAAVAPIVIGVNKSRAIVGIALSSAADTAAVSVLLK